MRTHVTISGDVTGVGFRAWTVRNAIELGLAGWVRNTEKGTLEAVFEGEKKDVEKMIELCKKGPEVAWVEKVDVKRESPPAGGEFAGFEIRY